MTNETYNIIAAAIVGSVFTLIIQALTHFIKRRRIKVSLNQFFRDVIIPICIKIKEESTMIKEYIDSRTYGDLTLGMHPALNSEILKTYSLDDIKSAYGNKMPVFIGIISMIDNLKGRLPLVYFNTLVKDVESHIKEASTLDKSDNRKEIFDSYDAHFANCDVIQLMRDRVKINLGHVEKIANSLEDDIRKLKQ